LTVDRYNHSFAMGLRQLRRSLRLAGGGKEPWRRHTAPHGAARCWGRGRVWAGV